MIIQTWIKICSRCYNKTNVSTVILDWFYLKKSAVLMAKKITLYIIPCFSQVTWCACYLLQVDFRFGLLFNLEHGGEIFLKTSVSFHQIACILSQKTELFNLI
jgi:hypothetical protein